MPRHNETRGVPYSPQQMFDLVADVPSYARFLPWVSAVRVTMDKPGEMVADLMVGFKALREKFTSHVTKQPPTSDAPGRVHVDYVEGPLKYLRNDWVFRPDGKGGTLIDFSIDFEFKSKIFEMIAGQMFQSALKRMIGAFEERAAALYSSDGRSAAPGSSSSSAHNAA
jgi:coenzyme Q-binding protein COQ10